MTIFGVVANFFFFVAPNYAFFSFDYHKIFSVLLNDNFLCNRHLTRPSPLHFFFLRALQYFGPAVRCADLFARSTLPCGTFARAHPWGNVSSLVASKRKVSCFDICHDALLIRPVVTKLEPIASSKEKFIWETPCSIQKFVHIYVYGSCCKYYKYLRAYS